MVRAVRRFEKHATALTESPKVQLRMRPLGPDGKPLRRPGRPRGVRNGRGGTIHGAADQLAALPESMRPDDAA